MGFASRVGAQLSQRHIIVRGIVRTGMSPQASKLELSLMPGLPRYLLITYPHPSSLHLVHLMNVVVRKPTVTHFFTHTKHAHMARGHKLHDVRPLTNPRNPRRPVPWKNHELDATTGDCAGSGGGGFVGFPCACQQFLRALWMLLLRALLLVSRQALPAIGESPAAERVSLQTVWHVENGRVSQGAERVSVARFVGGKRQPLAERATGGRRGRGRGGVGGTCERKEDLLSGLQCGRKSGVPPRVVRSSGVRILL